MTKESVDRPVNAEKRAKRVWKGRKVTLARKGSLGYQVRKEFLDWKDWKGLKVSKGRVVKVD